MRHLLFLILFGVASQSITALADEPTFSIGVGSYDRSGDEPMLNLQIEGSSIENLWSIRPTLSFLADTEQSFYLGIGLTKYFKIDPLWRLGIGVHAGWYDADEPSRDLGNSLEFYTRLSVGYAINSEQHIELAYGHISNADLGDTNPGGETLSINWVRAF